MPAPSILIVDDEPHIRDVVRFAVERAGYRCLEAGDAAEARVRLAEHRPDLVVLDVMLPDLPGTELCKEIRRVSGVPILFLSSRDDEIDRVLGLELGGDDYVTKPFSPRELVSRIGAVLRRGPRLDTARPPPADEPPLLRCGRLSVDSARHAVAWDGRPVALTAVEFTLISALIRRPGIVFDRERLVDKVYAGQVHVSDRTIDSHIRNLRKKLAEVGADPIETVHGVGYRLREPT